MNLNKDIRHITFENCKFHNIISKELKIDSSFINCVFNEINIYEVSLGLEFKDCSIGKFKINNSELTNPISIKNMENKKVSIGTLEIYDSLFKSSFSLINIEIHFLTIDNTDFEKNLNFNNIVVHDEIKFKEIKFKDLALFDDCNFNEKAEFKYVIFEKFTSFRGSKFSKGIDLEYTSNDKEINFYGMEILDKTTTSQETYRIIKNQFEKLNNKIEANKYHSLELEQRKKELEKNKCHNLSDYLIFKIHELSSKHSTSWVRALVCIASVSFFTIFLVHFDIVKDVFFNPSNFRIEYLQKIWDEFWQYINITNLEKLKDKPFILFINKLSLGYLYYQFLTAVRKDTRK